jgi:hypothetical protein
MQFEHLKHRFLHLTKFAICVWKRADNLVAGCVETMKHRFIDFNQFVFCGGQKAGDVISGLLEHLKHRFFDFTKVAFATSRRQLMSSEDHSTT